MYFCSLIDHYFLPLNKIPLYGSPQFVRSPFEGHLGGFWFSATMSKAVINIYVQVSVWTEVLQSLVEIPWSSMRTVWLDYVQLRNRLPSCTPAWLPRLPFPPGDDSELPQPHVLASTRRCPFFGFGSF